MACPQAEMSSVHSALAMGVNDGGYIAGSGALLHERCDFLISQVSMGLGLPWAGIRCCLYVVAPAMGWMGSG